MLMAENVASHETTSSSNMDVVQNWWSAVQILALFSEQPFSKYVQIVAARLVGTCVDFSVPILVGLIVDTRLSDGKSAVHPALSLTVGAGLLILVGYKLRQYSTKECDRITCGAMKELILQASKRLSPDFVSPHDLDNAAGLARNVMRAAWSFQIVGQVVFNRLLPGIGSALVVAVIFMHASPMLAIFFIVWCFGFLIHTVSSCKHRIQRNAYAALLDDTEISRELHEVLSRVRPQKTSIREVTNRWGNTNLTWLNGITDSSSHQYIAVTMSLVIFNVLAVIFWSSGAISNGQLTSIVGVLTLSFNQWNEVGAQLRLLQRSTDPIRALPHQLTERSRRCEEEKHKEL